MGTIVVGVDGSPAPAWPWLRRPTRRPAGPHRAGGVHAFPGPAAMPGAGRPGPTRVAAGLPRSRWRRPSPRRPCRPGLLTVAAGDRALGRRARGHDGLDGHAAGLGQPPPGGPRRVPVAVIRPGGRPGSIVVGVDGSARLRPGPAVGGGRGPAPAVPVDRGPRLAVPAHRLVHCDPAQGYDAMAAEFVDQALATVRRATPSSRSTASSPTARASRPWSGRPRRPSWWWSGPGATAASPACSWGRSATSAPSTASARSWSCGAGVPRPPRGPMPGPRSQPMWASNHSRVRRQASAATSGW